jgi:hypothetical protein
MGIEKFKRLKNLYLLSLVVGLGIYFYLKVENKTLNMQEEKYNLMIIVFLLLIGCVIVGVKWRLGRKMERLYQKPQFMVDYLLLQYLIYFAY